MQVCEWDDNGRRHGRPVGTSGLYGTYYGTVDIWGAGPAVRAQRVQRLKSISSVPHATQLGSARSAALTVFDVSGTL